MREIWQTLEEKICSMEKKIQLSQECRGKNLVVETFVCLDEVPVDNDLRVMM
jgi:hypothetical protein